MNDTQKAKWKNLGKKIGGIAPWIAGMLGGPAVGKGAELVIDFFGKDDPDEIAKEIERMTPEQRIAFEQYDTARKMNEQDNLTERLKSDNATTSRFVQYTRPGIAWVWTAMGILVAICGLVMAFMHSDHRVQLYLYVASFTILILAGIYMFYFGSRGFEKISAILGNRFGTNPIGGRITSIFREK